MRRGVVGNSSYEEKLLTLQQYQYHQEYLNYGNHVVNNVQQLRKYLDIEMFLLLKKPQRIDRFKKGLNTLVQAPRTLNRRDIVNVSRMPDEHQAEPFLSHVFKNSFNPYY